MKTPKSEGDIFDAVVHNITAAMLVHAQGENAGAVIAATLDVITTVSGYLGDDPPVLKSIATHFHKVASELDEKADAILAARVQ